MDTALKITKACDEVRDLLLSKNKRYGDSALNPVRIFSKASDVDQLLVRIDDKLSRISRGAGLVASDEDVIQDLIGYLVLLKIAMGEQKPELNYDEIQKADLLDYRYQSEWVDNQEDFDCMFSLSSRSPD